MENQTGKTALITGATSGIGRELTTLFAKDGYNLVLVARGEDNLLETAEQLENQFGIKVLPIGKDLSDPKAPEEIYDETKRNGLVIDVLVNNAGAGEYGQFATETDLHKELGIIQLNATSLVHLTKLYLKDMKQQNAGKILMLASVASIIPNPLMAVYGATKSFIYSFSEALRNELKDTNITITALMPGATGTDFFNKAGASNIKATDKLADPAGVAKDGYEALMAGKDKVVSGFMNKVQVAMAQVLPDQVMANLSHRDMEEKPAPQKPHEEQMSTLAIGLGVAAVAIAGLFIASAYRNASFADKAAYKYKAYSAKKSLKDALASAKDKAQDAFA